MNKYNVKDYTYGCELEFADVEINTPLPIGCNWNKKDYSIVNSNGIANDPSGKLYNFGGEINTKPTQTIKEQLDIIEKIIQNLKPEPVLNYKCNLHIHIGIPNLYNDLDSLKKIMRYIKTIPEEVWQVIDPIEKPDKKYFETEEAFKAAKKRYRRNLVSHRYQLPEKRFNAVINSKTLTEFFEKHAILKNNKPLWAISPRCGINLRQIQETNTVEFRHFFGTLNIKEYESCLIWCQQFIRYALNDLGSCNQILLDNPGLIFPKPIRYNHFLGQGFELTNQHSNKKEDIIKNINLLLNKKI